MTFQLQIDKNSFQFHKFLPAYAPELHPVEYLCGRTGNSTSCPTSVRRISGS